MKQDISTDEMLPWVAGLLEGEGCFQMTDEIYPRVKLEMCDMDVVAQFADFCRMRYDTTTTISYHEPHNPDHSPRYIYRINGKKAIALMEDIYEWMGIRRQEKIDMLIRKAYNADY